MNRAEDGGAADDMGGLVDGAIRALGTLARRGSALTTGVAIIAAVVCGLTYLLGLAAFDGGARSTWIVLGALLLVGAVGAPLLASVRLRSLPRRSSQLAGELRTLLQRDDDAKRVVVETVSWEDDDVVRPGPAGRPMPAVVWQSQHYTTMRRIVGSSDDVKNLAAAFQRIASLPWLVTVGLMLTGLGGFLGFVFFWIWVL